MLFNEFFIFYVFIKIVYNEVCRAVLWLIIFLVVANFVDKLTGNMFVSFSLYQFLLPISLNWKNRQT